MNSSKSMTSSPVWSYSSRKLSMALSPCTCRILSLARPVKIFRSSFFVTVPLPSISNILKASQTTSSLRILFLSIAAAINSVYSMVSFPSVPACTANSAKSPGIKTPLLSNAFRNSSTVTNPFPSRSMDSNTIRKCCVSSSDARHASAVIDAFCSMLRDWKCIMDSRMSCIMSSVGKSMSCCIHGCSRASMTSQRVSGFFRKSSAINVFASFDIFFHRLSLKLTGSLRIACKSSSFVFPRKGYCPESIMYITTPELQASHF
mmetsp:Transcript_46888/g.74044  ORF Transcript_46888/g.74044 Transcript_46888/m.74044 type:complete len:261 (+) Transcript_46888:396-1178(+)